MRDNTPAPNAGNTARPQTNPGNSNTTGKLHEGGTANTATASGPSGEGRATSARFQYGTVVLLIAIAYGLCATQATPQSNTLTLLLQLVTVGIIFHVAEAGRILRRITYTVLAVAGVLTIAATFSGVQGHALDVGLAIATMLSYLISPGIIIRQQLRRAQIDAQTLLAAIAAYLLLGMFFTFVYNLIGLFAPMGIFGTIETNTLASQLFFSFATLTTTGYGNNVPIEPFGQSVAIAEAIIGQLFLVVAVARIVTAMVPSPRRTQQLAAADNEAEGP